MSAACVLFCIVGGTAAAWVLNKLLAGRIENKSHRIGLKVTAYIVCIVLVIAFAALGSLRTILNTFLEDRIEFMEIKLVEFFPDSNILETSIDTGEITQVIDELRQSVNGINTNNDSFFEGLVFNAFLNRLTGYIDAAENGVNVIAAGGANDPVTVKSMLYNLKDLALEAISPYFVFGQIVIIILFVIFIGIYAGIAAFLKKGGARHNKSMVFGDIDYDREGEKSQNGE